MAPLHNNSHNKGPLGLVVRFLLWAYHGNCRRSRVRTSEWPSRFSCEYDNFFFVSIFVPNICDGGPSH